MPASAGTDCHGSQQIMNELSPCSCAAVRWLSIVRLRLHCSNSITIVGCAPTTLAHSSTFHGSAAMPNSRPAARAGSAEGDSVLGGGGTSRCPVHPARPETIPTVSRTATHLRMAAPLRPPDRDTDALAGGHAPGPC